MWGWWQRNWLNNWTIEDWGRFQGKGLQLIGLELAVEVQKSLTTRKRGSDKLMDGWQMDGWSNELVGIDMSEQHQKLCFKYETLKIINYNYIKSFHFNAFKSSDMQFMQQFSTPYPPWSNFIQRPAPKPDSRPVNNCNYPAPFQPHPINPYVATFGGCTHL